MEYIIPKEAQRYRLPILEAYLKVSSQESSNLNRYNQYLLELLYKNKSIDYICDITKFKQSQVEDELLTLVAYDMVEMSQTDGTYTLTKLGTSIVKGLEEVEKFNKEHIKVLIDKNSGTIICDDVEYLHEKENSYRIKIVKDIYRNLNPANAKNLLIDEFETWFEHIECEDLDVELELGEESWVEVNSNVVVPFVEEGDAVCTLQMPGIDIVKDDLNLDEIMELNEKQGVNPVCVEGVVYPIYFKVKNYSIDQYREHIALIKQLGEIDDELLSGKSVNIIKAYEIEQHINSEILKTVYVDGISGRITLHEPLKEKKLVRNPLAMDTIFKMENIKEDTLKKIAKGVFKELEIYLVDNQLIIEHEVGAAIKVRKELPLQILLD